MQQNGSVNALEQILKKFDAKAHKTHVKLPTKPICCVCLGDRSDDTNEIIECDGCGVSVHEGCYGVSDNASISSTNSTCSTEPWFCEACRAGIKDPSCELCPNAGGIFKETDVGRWVHLVCALYISRVAFGEVDQLSAVTLFEMPYSKWGAKLCSLCENARYARTGVCIECDAGMCKAYFHVTCAQAVGFLTEGQNEDEALDPYYAHCKMHSDKDMLKKRKRNYNMLRLHMQQKQLELKVDAVLDAAQQRNKRKLAKYQMRYQQHKQLKGTPWVPTQKMSRLLTTSASAVKRLLAKAKLMGNNVDELEKREAQISVLVDIRKRWHIQPAFNIEFIGYYYDRICRLKELKSEVTGMAEQHVLLNKSQDVLRKDYDNYLEENVRLKEQHAQLLARVQSLQKHVELFYDKTLVPAANLPQPVKPPARPISVPTAAALKMGVGFPLSHLNNNHSTVKQLSTHAQQETATTEQMSLNLPPVALAHDCGICKRSQDQHLLTKCDTCNLYYHLGCLQPPLTRPPKKSKLYGWQCSECDKSDDDEAAPQMPKGPRKSRTRFNKDGSIVLDKSEQAAQLASPTNSSMQPVIANLNADESLELLLPTNVIDKNCPSASIVNMAFNNNSNNNNNANNNVDNPDLKKLARKQKRKDKKNKHNLSSDGSDKSPNKERKHKRKKKHSDVSEEQTSSIPKIKIKFKTLPLPGEVTPEAKFFYVSADTVRSAEDDASRPTSVESIDEQVPPPVVVEAAPAMPVETSPRKFKARKKAKGKLKLSPSSAIGAVSSVTQSPAKKQRESISMPCSVCKEMGTNANMVCCDECRKNYHFTCLEPPLKKSPKIRGYSWHCADCDPTDEERK